jgi:hypothetical protein
MTEVTPNTMKGRAGLWSWVPSRTMKGAEIPPTRAASFSAPSTADLTRVGNSSVGQAEAHQGKAGQPICTAYQHA